MPETDPPADGPATRASAHLPGLDIEIVHRRSPAGDVEHITIDLRAVPSFAQFGSWFGAATPFAWWMLATQMMWAPWLAVAEVMMGQAGHARPLPRVSGRSHSIVPEQEPR